MPRDTDRPDPSLTTPLGPPIRQAAPAPAPAPIKAPQPMQMDMADVPMIIRDCHAKPTKLNEQQRADWLRMSAEPAGFDVAVQVGPPLQEWVKARNKAGKMLLACIKEMHGHAPRMDAEPASYAELWANPDPTARLQNGYGADPATISRAAKKFADAMDRNHVQVMVSAAPELHHRRHGETIGDLFRLEGHPGKVFVVTGHLKESGKPVIRPMGYRDDSLPLLDPRDFSVIQAPERPKIDVDKAVQWVDERLPELHPRRHLDWPVIDPDMIEQAPRRRAAWLPEGD